MRRVKCISEIRSLSRNARSDGKRIGLVPTMGFLHDGHLSLIRAARANCDCLVVSIFVNPTQFAPSEDLAKYPRDIDGDLAACEKEGVDLVFAPLPEEMFKNDKSVEIMESRISTGLCGKSRPAFFAGVATVVGKLFNIIEPDLAVFGQKDAQQARVIQKMVRDLDFCVEIQVGPIVRESDGLAMSSRNSYLSATARIQATCLSRALKIAVERYGKGEHKSDLLKAKMRDCIEESELARVDYIDIVDAFTMDPVDSIDGSVFVCLAVSLDGVRLIDNVLISAGAVPPGFLPQSLP